MSNPNDHSQCGESAWILDNLKPDKGFFVEVGSFDGVQFSNTYLFEALGWNGLLIEADPFLAGQSQLKRKAKTLCCAAGTGRIQDFYINLEDRGLSGFAARTSNISIPVVTLTLDFIVTVMHIDEIDLLSIDVEGTELEVWKSLTLLRPKIVILEYQTCDNPSNEAEIVNQMTSDQYSLRYKTSYNLIFTR